MMCKFALASSLRLAPGAHLNVLHVRLARTEGQWALLIAMSTMRGRYEICVEVENLVLHVETLRLIQIVIPQLVSEHCFL